MSARNRDLPVVVADLTQLKENWETLAQRDPMWAILSVPAMKGKKWDPEAFFRSGREGIDSILRQIADANWPLHLGTALDFGCGLGRITQALARHFQQTYGVDISGTMIAEAGRYNRFGDACTYILNDSPDLRRFADDRFDFIYSDAVLQHIPPDAGKAYISEFVRVLKPGGLLAFQVPAHLRVAHATSTAEAAPRQADADRPSDAATCTERACPTDEEPAREAQNYESGGTGDDLEKLIDMHGIPQEEVCRLLNERGATVLSLQEESWSGPEWVNFRYWVTKHPR